jgi:hypothetical protein
MLQNTNTSTTKKRIYAISIIYAGRQQLQAIKKKGNKRTCKELPSSSTIPVVLSASFPKLP